MLSEDKPLRVPVDINGWRWPLWVGRVECGECGEVVAVERCSALSELAEAIELHASRCRRA